MTSDRADIHEIDLKARKIETKLEEIFQGQFGEATSFSILYCCLYIWFVQFIKYFDSNFIQITLESS